MTSGVTSPALPRSLESIRAEFPILSREVKGTPLSYLDNGATVQKPAAVIEAIDGYYREHNANVHRGVHTLSEEATSLYEGARASVAAHIGAHPREVIFTRNVTGAINLVAQAWGQQNLGPGDRILLTEMEHHSNIVPWYLIAERTGAELDWVGIDDDGRLDQEELEAGLAREPKIFAFTHVSNVLGTTNPVAETGRQGQGRRRPDPDRRRPGRTEDGTRHESDRRRLLRLHRPQVLRPDRHRRPLRAPRAAGRTRALRRRRFDDQQGDEGQDHLGFGPGQVRGRHPADRRSRRTRRRG